MGLVRRRKSSGRSNETGVFMLIPFSDLGTVVPRPATAELRHDLSGVSAGYSTFELQDYFQSRFCTKAPYRTKRQVQLWRW